MKLIPILFILNLLTMRTVSQKQDFVLHSPFRNQADWGRSKISGDFNGDGLTDLAVCATGIKNGKGELTGMVTIHYGSKSGFASKPEAVLEPEYPGHSYGVSNCTSGDFNADGFDDLVISNPFFGEPQLDRGYVQIFMGSREGLLTGASKIKVGETAYGSFGSNISRLDFNGDQVDDLLVESRFDHVFEGRILIYCGKKEFTIEQPDYVLGVRNSQSLYYCFSDDLNNDGAGDVVCRSNAHWNASATQVYVFFGGEKAKGTYDLKFNLGNFTPRFYLRSCSLMVGTTLNYHIETFSEGLKIQPSGYEIIRWKEKGFPVRINEGTMAVFHSDSIGTFTFYQVEKGTGNPKELNKKYINSPDPSNPVMFGNDRGKFPELMLNGSDPVERIYFISFPGMKDYIGSDMKKD